MKIDSSNYMLTANSSQSVQNENNRKPLGIERSSGNVCPQSGYWQVANPTITAVVSVKKGDIIPYHQGRPVNWQLIKYDFTKYMDI